MCRTQAKTQWATGGSVCDLKSQGEVKQQMSIPGCCVEPHRRLSDFFCALNDWQSLLKEGKIGGETILTGRKGGKRMCLTLGSFQLCTSGTASLSLEKSQIYKIEIQDWRVKIQILLGSSLFTWELSPELGMRLASKHVKMYVSQSR